MAREPTVPPHDLSKPCQRTPVQGLSFIYEPLYLLHGLLQFVGVGSTMPFYFPFNLPEVEVGREFCVILRSDNGTLYVTVELEDRRRGHSRFFALHFVYAFGGDLVDLSFIDDDGH